MKLLDYLQILHNSSPEIYDGQLINYNKISSPKIYRGQLLYYRLNDRLVEAKICVEPKQYSISDFEIVIETRNNQIFIYIFHKNFCYGFNDSTHLYEILNNDFYNEFKYVFDKNNLWSLNEYTPKHMKTERECIDFLESIGFITM